MISEIASARRRALSDAIVVAETRVDETIETMATIAQNTTTTAATAKQRRFHVPKRSRAKNARIASAFARSATMYSAHVAVCTSFTLTRATKRKRPDQFGRGVFDSMT